MEQKREIYQLESGLLKLKQQNNNFSKSFRQPNKKLLPLKMDISEENLEKKEKETDENCEKLLEKEKEMLALKEKMNELEVYYETQISSCIGEIKSLQSHGNTDEVESFFLYF